MIIRIELLEEYRSMKPFVMEPDPHINLIVGENGSGKSSLMGAMVKDFPEIKVERNSDKYVYFDTEKDNPRIQSYQPFNATGEEVAYSLSVNFNSHGEVMFPILDHMKTFKNRMLFLDEPESGISIRNQIKMCDSIRKAIKNGCQFFIATHSYILIKKFKKVFDLKTYEFMGSEEWLSQFNI